MINYGSIPESRLVTPPKPEYQSKLSELNTHELAWAAGFFDGEGSTVYSANTKSRRFQLGMRISQAGEFAPAVLRRFQKALLGLGKVYGPYTSVQGTSKLKPYFYFTISNFEDTQAAIALLWNYLGPQKREQAKNALTSWHMRPIAA